MMNKLCFSSAILALLSVTATRAQSTIERSVVASSGNSSTTGGYHIDWTVGEAVINGYTAGGYSLNQGFHQQTTISLGINSQQLDVVTDAYPNPFTDQLWLRVKQSGPADLTAVITDINGKQLLKEALQMRTTIDHQFNTGIFPGGHYFLIVYQDKIPVRTIKLVKK